MHEPNQEKIAFITFRSVFCYKVMSFGLKNTGAKYQRMITKIFESILGKTMDAYIDDMVVKSIKESDHIKDLTKVFTILKRHKLKLNAKKCAFRVNSRNCLAHMVTRRGIDGNPEQITAISILVSPKTGKEVQTLIEMAVALNQFSS